MLSFPTARPILRGFTVRPLSRGLPQIPPPKTAGVCLGEVCDWSCCLPYFLGHSGSSRTGSLGELKDQVTGSLLGLIPHLPLPCGLKEHDQGNSVVLDVRRGPQQTPPAFMGV